MATSPVTWTCKGCGEILGFWMHPTTGALARAFPTGCLLIVAEAASPAEPFADCERVTCRLCGVTNVWYWEREVSRGLSDAG